MDEQRRLRTLATCRLLAAVEPGEAVGELTAADGGARSATIAALTGTTVLRIPREAVPAAARRSPGLTRALRQSLDAAPHGFPRRGWVTVGAREIRLHDVDALNRFVG